MPEPKNSMEQIFECAQAAERDADEAILRSELTSEDPTLIALRGAHDALKRIRVAAEIDSQPPMDTGQL